MAQSRYTLSVLLQGDNASLKKALAGSLADLRRFKAESDKLLGGAGGGRPGGSGAALQQLKEESRLLREQARLRTDTARAVGVEGRNKAQGSVAAIRMLHEEVKLRQASARLSQTQSRTSSAGEMASVRLARERIKLLREEARLRDGRPSSGAGGTLGALAAGYGSGRFVAAGYRASTSQEDAVANLRTSFAKVGPDGKVDEGRLNSEVSAAMSQAVELGNKLPGNTTQFLDLARTLKQRGMGAEDVLGGALRSSAYLATANRSDPAQTAEEVAQFGSIYGLKGKEFERSADLLSRINTAKGLDARELIDASKYFQGRAGQPLGLKGLEGAEQSTRFLAFMRQSSGLEGTSVGTASGTFLTNLIKKPKEVARLSKETGVDLSPVDKSGRFIGLESLVEKFAKLDGKLSNKQQVEFGGKIAGEEGSAIFSALVSKGAQFGAFNDQINSTMGMMQKAEVMTATTTARMESLAGSWENLMAQMFERPTKSLDPLIERTNTYLGQLQSLAAQHENVAGFTAGVVGIGGAAVGATPGVGSLIDKLGLLGGGSGGGGRYGGGGGEGGSNTSGGITGNTVLDFGIYEGGKRIVNKLGGAKNLIRPLLSHPAAAATVAAVGTVGYLGYKYGDSKPGRADAGYKIRNFSRLGDAGATNQAQASTRIESSGALSAIFGQDYKSLADSARGAGEGLQALQRPASDLPGAFSRVSSSAGFLASRLNSLEVKAPTFNFDSPTFGGPRPQPQSSPSIFSPLGGKVFQSSYRDSLDAAPQMMTAAYAGGRGGGYGGGGGGDTYNVTVQVPEGSRAADDPQALAALVGEAIARERSQMKREVIRDIAHADRVRQERV